MVSAGFGPSNLVSFKTVDLSDESKRKENRNSWIRFGIQFRALGRKQSIYILYKEGLFIRYEYSWNYAETFTYFKNEIIKFLKMKRKNLTFWTYQRWGNEWKQGKNCMRSRESNHRRKKVRHFLSESLITHFYNSRWWLIEIFKSLILWVYSA